MLIDPDRRSVEIFRRTADDDWLLATRDGERGLVLPPLGFIAGLEAVFEDVGEPSPPERRRRTGKRQEWEFARRRLSLATSTIRNKY